jgi:pimeloyl-ACP methyl ester carboxylesterase
MDGAPLPRYESAGTILLVIGLLLSIAAVALVADVSMSFVGWRGLTIAGRRWLPLTLPLLGVALWALFRADPSPPTLGIGFLVGGIAFLALAIWRQRHATPATLFTPGTNGSRRVEALTIPLPNGELPAVLVAPRDGSRIGILVVHGAGDHKTHFTWPLLWTLADTGFAVCAIDVDGHGDNQRVLQFPDVLQNVTAGVAWLRERYNRVAVIGISQGGCISARAVADGLAVDALALLETPISVNVTKAVVRREARILAHPAAWALHREVGTIGLARHWRTPPTRTRIGTVDLIARLDALGSVARIKPPLLLCYGASDAVVPIEQGQRMAEAAPPGTTFVVVPGATHLSLSIDRRVARLVADWLRQTLTTDRETERT